MVEYVLIAHEKRNTQSNVTKMLENRRVFLKEICHYSWMKLNMMLSTLLLIVVCVVNLYEENVMDNFMKCTI